MLKNSCSSCSVCSSFFVLVTLFCPGSFSETTIDKGIINTVRTVINFGGFVNVVSHLEGQIPKITTKQGSE